jgi:oxygen-independent coproporphyrinogen-3 oxidase
VAFRYRDGLFNGTDVLSVGVSSFGYLKGVNYQNLHDFQPYIDKVNEGALPTYRAYSLSREEQYIREFGLQLKGGSVLCAPFARKFGTDPREQFAAPLAILRSRGVLAEEGDRIALTRDGLLQVDRLIFEFFRPEHQTGRFA